MEIRIQGETADELCYKIVSMARKLETPKNTPSAVPNPVVKAQTAPEPKAESIFTQAPVQAGKGKKKAAAPVAEVVDHEAEAVAANEAVESEADTETTEESLAESLREVIAKCGGNTAREMMGKLGYTHIGKIPKDEHSKFLKACNDTIKTKSKK